MRGLVEHLPLGLLPQRDVEAPQGGDLVLHEGVGAVGRRRPPLDADRGIAFDPALALPPADRLAGDGQFPVDGVGVHLVRPRRRQLGQDLRQCRVVDRGDGEDGGLRASAGGPVGAGSPVSVPPHVVSEMRWIRAEDFAMPAPVR
ncbi:hypothetical protein QWM81_04820 [Streptomyces ficellus]|uniref:Uncharacterized protein n=1 Tax=Streptomyces ficellus TaxID=1977088 RepID=A0ABT7Z1K9_9ACTN|nr:hypothetical protein [Streptomyces ficellus]MDN3293378.1 hypothetical protein [Streptomyces ficellus]